jgi:chitin disaccharide deacetylase
MTQNGDAHVRQRDPIGTTRSLIVNADDFGQSAGVNRGIITAIKHGIVTSSSLMVRWPDAPDAVAFAATQSDLSLGLHLDLGEWAIRDGDWIPVYNVVNTDDERDVGREIDRQLTAFRRLTGHDPTHLDSHQHVHRQEPVLGLTRAVAAELGIPLRHLAPEVRHCGAFYGQTADGQSLPNGVSVRHLISILESLPPGVSELCCHPGEGGGPGSMYDAERRIEVKTLCAPMIRDTLSRLSIRLCSYSSVR